MATVAPPAVREDGIEDELIRVDLDYATVYGPNVQSWSKGVRGEYLERLRARRTMDHEAHPVHPRKCSAGRRRRHVAQLAYRIHQTAPDAATVLLTPVWTDVHGPMKRVYIATAMTADGARLKLPTGGSHRLADLMQGAYPSADWDRPQTWHRDTNRITTWGRASRAFRDTADSGFVESLAAFDARMDAREAT
ncbi:hypothetical protein ACWGH2_29495 [Streptomyces sp. NPDC054871]